MAARYREVFREWGREGGRKGGKRRAEKLTPERRKEIASKGGKAAAGKPRKLTLTAAQRRDRARKAALARWQQKAE